MREPPVVYQQNEVQIDKYKNNMGIGYIYSEISNIGLLAGKKIHKGHFEIVEMQALILCMILLPFSYSGSVVSKIIFPNTFIFIYSTVQQNIYECTEKDIQLINKIKWKIYLDTSNNNLRLWFIVESRQYFISAWLVVCLSEERFSKYGCPT